MLNTHWKARRRPSLKEELESEPCVPGVSALNSPDTCWPNGEEGGSAAFVSVAERDRELSAVEEISALIY